MIVNDILIKYKAQPVGNGYIDCIVKKEYVKGLINELSNANIKITGVSWWCHHTYENDKKYNYQYGMGGPKSIYFEGWFSEVPYIFGSNFIDNTGVLNYIFIKVKGNKFYSDCLCPGLWLEC